MKKHSFSYNVLIIFLILFSCTGEDLVDNYQEPELRTIESVATIFLGQNQKIVVRFFNLIGEEVKNPNLNWSSSDSTILDVNQDGSLVPKKVGNATITVSVETSDPKNPVKKTEFNIEVKSNVITIEPEVTETPELTISPPDSPIQKDEEIDLNYSFTDAETGNQLDPEMVSWASSDENIALVDENGTINGLTPGNVTITLTITYDDETYEEEFVVEVIVTPELSIGTEESTIRVNEILELNPIFKGFDGQEVEDVELIFSSDDNQIASVDEMGNITGVKAGEVEITITVNYEGQTYSKQVQLSVNLEPALIIQNSVATLTEGKSENITAIFTDEKGNENNQVTIQWESLTPELIEVDQDGNVQAVAAGEAKVKASLTYNDELFEKEITIQIEEKLTYTINLIEPINNLYEGNSSKLNFEIIDSKGQAVENPSVMWSSSEPTLVQVDQSGNIQGLAIGSSIITLTTEIDGTEYTEEHSLTIIPIPAISITNVIETLVEGESHRFVSKFDDQAEGENLSIETTWSSSDENVIEINEQGTITALKAGSAEIEVSTNYKGQQYSTKISISVTAKPQEEPPVAQNPEITIVGAVSEIELEKSISLSFELNDSELGELSEQSFEWKSSNPEIATVGSSGNLLALNPGNATITVTVVYNDTPYEQSFQIRVNNVAVKPVLTLSDTIASLESGSSHQTQFSFINDVDGTLLEPSSLTWVSDDQSVATVSSDGQISAQSPGTTTIILTVEYEDEQFQQTFNLQVWVQPTLEITNEISQLKIYDLENLNVLYTDDAGDEAEADVSWSSSDESIISINQNGQIEAISTGTVTITASITYDGQEIEDTITIMVFVEPELIITSDISQLKVDDSENLSVLFTDDSGDEAETDVNWSSSDDSIISINQNGQIEAISTGTATITATTSYDGQEIEDTLTIKVIVDPEVRITSDISRLELNDRVNLNYSYTDDSGQEQSPQSVSWESSDPSIVSVNSNGRITATGIGSAEITVTTSEDNQTYTDTVTIQVFVTPKVSITNPAGGIIEGTSYDFDFSFTDDEGNTATPDSIEWDSGDENVLTIDNEGVVTTVGSGTSRITLTVTYDGSTYDTDFNFIIQENPNSDSGGETESFKGTLSGSYGLKGGYEVKAEGNDLLIILDANYSINSSLPDGALYLSNTDKHPNDESKLVWHGDKSHYKGPRTYTVENVGLKDYRYLLFYCVEYSTNVGTIKLFD